MDTDLIGASFVLFTAARFLAAVTKKKNITKEKESKIVKKRGRGPDRKWIQRREERGVMNTLVQELRLEDIHSYRNWMRMNEDQFLFLVSIIEGDISKQKTPMRQTVKADERLSITLKYLATGMSFKDLHYIYRVGERTVSNIVAEVTLALIKRLHYTFQWPETQTDWKSIANQFWSKCNLPNCIGAIDGKHITIRKPWNSGSHYHNYKGSESIVLMAIVDSNLLFRYVDVGINGSISDGGVWDRCKISRLMQQNQLNLPEPSFFPESGETTPYYFVADAAFPLSPNLMKPYPDRGLTAAQAIFNYRLYRGRRCVECAFGALASRYRIFHTSIALQPEKVKNIVLAACSLHNYLALESTRDTAVEQVDTLPTNNMLGLHPNLGRNPNTFAKQTRDRLSHYFLTEAGRVPWQNEAAHLAG